MAKRKVGETFSITLQDLASPLIGNLVEVTLDGEEAVNTRVMTIENGLATVKVVPDSTKE